MNAWFQSLQTSSDRIKSHITWNMQQKEEIFALEREKKNEGCEKRVGEYELGSFFTIAFELIMRE